MKIIINIQLIECLKVLGNEGGDFASLVVPTIDIRSSKILL